MTSSMALRFGARKSLKAALARREKRDVRTAARSSTTEAVIGPV